MAIEGVSENRASSVAAAPAKERRKEETRVEEEQRDRSPPKVEGKGERVDTAA